MDNFSPFLRPAYLSAFRGSRTSAAVPQPPSVPSPVGAQTSMTTAAQAQALRKKRPPSILDTLPKDAQEQLQTAYGRGGFEGVKQIPGWYDLPEHIRTSILGGLNRIE